MVVPTYKKVVEDGVDKLEETTVKGLASVKKYSLAELTAERDKWQSLIDRCSGLSIKD